MSSPFLFFTWRPNMLLISDGHNVGVSATYPLPYSIVSATDFFEKIGVYMQKILVNFVFIFFNILALPSKASEQVTCEMLERKILNKITEDGGYLIVNGISILDRETRDIWLYGMPENVFSEPPHDKVIDLGLLPNGMHQKIFINCAKNNAIVLLQGGVVDQYVWFGPIAYQTFQTKIN